VRKERVAVCERRRKNGESSGEGQFFILLERSKRGERGEKLKSSKRDLGRKKKGVLWLKEKKDEGREALRPAVPIGGGKIAGHLRNGGRFWVTEMVKADTNNLACRRRLS